MQDINDGSALRPLRDHAVFAVRWQRDFARLSDAIFAALAASIRSPLSLIGAHGCGPRLHKVVVLRLGIQRAALCIFGLHQSRFRGLLPPDARRFWFLIVLPHGRLRPRFSRWLGFRRVQKGLTRALSDSGINRRGSTPFDVIADGDRGRPTAVLL